MEEWDAIIIGGGIAGASAAFELAEARRVVVLEQEVQAGAHATGRSAAVFIEPYGNEGRRARPSSTDRRAGSATFPVWSRNTIRRNFKRLT